jgi:DNA-binding NtrC family response regulator
MQDPILVVSANEQHCLELCAALEGEDYPITRLDSLEHLTGGIEGCDCRLAILDLDSLPIDNRLIRKLKRKNPSLRIIGFSRRTFHPELQEAMSSHIYACLGIPVDEEELVFWVKSSLEV